MRYCYKTKDEKGWVNLKSPELDNNPNYVKITESEYKEKMNLIKSKGE